MNTKAEVKDIYRQIAEEFLFEKYGINIIEKRIKEQGLNYIPAEKDGKLIHLFNEPHMERLLESEYLRFVELIENNDSERIVDFINETYRKVLYPETDIKSETEFFRDIYGNGIFPSNTILFVFNDLLSKIDLNEEEKKLEEKKDKLFQNVRVQYERIVNKENDENVRLIRK